MCKPEKLVSVCHFIGIIVGLFILSITSLINLLMAFLYKNQCPIEDWMWLYNVVAGSAGVFMLFNYILAAIFSQICNSRRLVWYFVLLGFVVFLCNSIWIIISLFKIVPLWTQGVVQYRNPALNTYCHPTLYNITQVLLVIDAVCIGLTGGNIAIAALVIIKT